MTVEFIKPTKRSKMTKVRAAKIFLAANGICCLCDTQIRAHVEKWFVEHPEALNLGGSDKDADLRPAHTKCKAEKDAADKKLIAKRNTAITKGCVDKPRKSRGFPKPPPGYNHWTRRIET